MAQKKKTTKSEKSKKNINNTQEKTTSSPYKKLIWGAVLVILGVFSALGYSKSDGLFIKIFCGLLKGLFGWGFYLIPPMLIIAAVVLVFSKKKLLGLRITSILLIPIVAGSLYQLLFTKGAYVLSFTAFKYLWLDGLKCTSGGAVSGMFTLLFTYLFSAAGAGILLFALLLGLIFVSCNQLIIGFIKKKIGKADKKTDTAEAVPADVPADTGKKSRRKKQNEPTIDIPVDEPIGDVLNEGKAKKTGKLFEKKKNDNIVVEGVVDSVVPFDEPVNPPPPKKSERLPKEDLIQEFTAGMEIDNGTQIYQFPPIEMLSSEAGTSRIDPRNEIQTNKERLENALESFGIHVNVSNIIRGPSVTRFEIELEAGVKLNKLTNLSDDIALSLGVSGVRIAAIPNKMSTVGIEVPNRNTSTVYLRDIIDTQEFKNSPSKLTFAIGKNIAGDAIVGNIAKLPHLLVAGTTGSGKSVCLNSLILSILYKATPEEVKFIMIDPKMVEFKIYNGIPHLLVPVVTEAKKSAGALQWAVTEMMKRYSIFADTGARDLQSYNKLIVGAEDMKPLPQIVVVIDELADLMLVAAKEVEESICRIAQMGRAAGVHLVIATQSPRADVITGLMKANIPSRISFKVASSLESRIILDAGGSAEKLMGNGDMLFAPIGVSKPIRIQGTWVTDEERENILNFIKESSQPDYSDEVIDEIEKAAEGKESSDEHPVEPLSDENDELFDQAVEVVLESGQASVSYLQRRLKVGYARAARIVDQMEDNGIVGPFEGSKPRQLLITKQEWQEKQMSHHNSPVEYSQKDIQQTLFDDNEHF